MTDTTQTTTADQGRAVRRTVVTCVSVAAGMIGLAYASVPLYDLFCRITGFGGTPIVGTAEAGTVLDETVNVRFDANVSRDLGWRFAAEAPQIEVRIGETQTVFYRVSNPSDEARAGVATFNVTPAIAGQYFVKLQCFCFTENTLAAGETMDSAVMFYIDPAIVEDPAAREISTITLSYTYFPSKNGLPEDDLADLDGDTLTNATAPTPQAAPSTL
ncbi:cytochrome c oxidase assembly protein [Salinarimonas chemoclinalis]|uniref:cytochrome c oxidase assembly protein n=1 Tax=Salinarimonas chemoclinalis TaxID=3241599 RepID=UPI0035570131